MNVDLGQIIVWVIVGLAVGTLVGRLFTRRKGGFGWIGNLIIGLVGAIIGGFLFSLLNINITNLALTFTLEDVLAAFVGAVIFVILLGFIRR